MASTITSRQLCLLLNLAKPALMAKLSVSLFILSCGDIISNPGPSIESRRKSKCNIFERTIACNHRSLIYIINVLVYPSKNIEISV